MATVTSLDVLYAMHQLIIKFVTYIFIITSVVTDVSFFLVKTQINYVKRIYKGNRVSD